MIIYNKLGGYLKERKLRYSDLQRATGLSPSLVAKFQKNRPVNTESIDKICSYLCCQPGDMMEWVKDEKEFEKKAIEAQIAELQAKLKTM